MLEFRGGFLFVKSSLAKTVPYLKSITISGTSNKNGRIQYIHLSTCHCNANARPIGFEWFVRFRTCSASVKSGFCAARSFRSSPANFGIESCKTAPVFPSGYGKGCVLCGGRCVPKLRTRPWAGLIGAHRFRVPGARLAVAMAVAWHVVRISGGFVPVLDILTKLSFSVPAESTNFFLEEKS